MIEFTKEYIESVAFNLIYIFTCATQVLRQCLSPPPPHSMFLLFIWCEHGREWFWYLFEENGQINNNVRTFALHLYGFCGFRERFLWFNLQIFELEIFELVCFLPTVLIVSFFFLPIYFKNGPIIGTPIILCFNLCNNLRNCFTGSWNRF